MEIGIPTYHFETLASTNDYAAQLIDAKKINDPSIEGTVINTHFQTKGRGQQQRAWHATAGENIMMSVILEPHWLAVKDQFGLNMISSIAVMETVQELTGVHAKVKWPNDVYVEDKKISGILIQNYIQGRQIKHTIIGIGLNVNQMNWPKEITHATSLQILKGESIDIQIVRNTLNYNLQTAYLKLKSNPRKLKEIYLKHLYRKDIEASFIVDGYDVIGVIRDVDPMGRLVVQIGEGYRSFLHGEIGFVNSTV